MSGKPWQQNSKTLKKTKNQYSQRDAEDQTLKVASTRIKSQKQRRQQQDAYLNTTSYQTHSKDYQQTTKSPIVKKHFKKQNGGAQRESELKNVPQHKQNQQSVTTSQAIDDITKILQPRESYTNLEAKIELSRQLIQKYQSELRRSQVEEPEEVETADLKKTAVHVQAEGEEPPECQQSQSQLFQAQCEQRLSDLEQKTERILKLIEDDAEIRKQSQQLLEDQINQMKQTQAAVFAKLLSKQKAQKKLTMRLLKHQQSTDQTQSDPHVLQDLSVQQKTLFIAQNQLAKQQLELKQRMDATLQKDDMADIVEAIQNLQQQIDQIKLIFNDCQFQEDEYEEQTIDPPRGNSQ